MINTCGEKQKEGGRRDSLHGEERGVALLTGVVRRLSLKGGYLSKDLEKSKPYR